MSDQNPNANDPEPAAALATLRGKLRLGRTVLIGTFGNESSPGALLRDPSGDIRRIALGDDVLGGKVTAIGTGRLVIASGGAERVLNLP